MEKQQENIWRKNCPQIRTTLRGRKSNSYYFTEHKSQGRGKGKALAGGLESGRLPNRLTLILALANHSKGKAHHCATDLANTEGGSSEQQSTEWYRVFFLTGSEVRRGAGAWGDLLRVTGTQRRQLDLCCLDDVDARQNACWGNLGDLPVFVHSRSFFSRSTLWS